tara:strand:- start:5399 stop:5821 length:423 start_codon:yes stop_codon:yes gene_type:complete
MHKLKANTQCRSHQIDTYPIFVLRFTTHVGHQKCRLNDSVLAQRIGVGSQVRQIMIEIQFFSIQGTHDPMNLGTAHYTAADLLADFTRCTSLFIEAKTKQKIRKRYMYTFNITWYVGIVRFEIMVTDITLKVIGFTLDWQ